MFSLITEVFSGEIYIPISVTGAGRDKFEAYQNARNAAIGTGKLSRNTPQQSSQFSKVGENLYYCNFTFIMKIKMPEIKSK